MRIISKHKDYYDFQQGVYGVDSLLILDRTEYSNKINLGNFAIIKIYVCDTEYQGVYYNEKFYWGTRIDDVIELLPKYPYYISDKEKAKDYHISDPNLSKSGRVNLTYRIPKIPIKYTINDDLNCPIIIENKFGKVSWKDKNYSLYPILIEYDFIDMLSPHDIWLEITNWLSKTKNLPDNQTNKEKIINNGFDLKTSFRGK